MDYDQISESDLILTGFMDAPIGLMVLSNRKIQLVNTEVERIFGWSRDELEGPINPHPLPLKCRLRKDRLPLAALAGWSGRVIRTSASCNAAAVRSSGPERQDGL